MRWQLSERWKVLPKHLQMHQGLEKRGDLDNCLFTRVTLSYRESRLRVSGVHWLSPGSSLRRRLHSIWRENSRDSEETSPSSNTESPSSGSSSRCLSAIRMTSSATSGCTAARGTQPLPPPGGTDPCPLHPPPPPLEGLGEEAELGTARTWTQPKWGESGSSVMPRAAHAPWHS